MFVVQIDQRDSRGRVIACEIDLVEEKHFRRIEDVVGNSGGKRIVRWKMDRDGRNVDGREVFQTDSIRLKYFSSTRSISQAIFLSLSNLSS